VIAATLFSGLGAPELAMPAWEWRWHAEIEPFPAAVMAARHPASVNLGDVTADDFCERATALGRPDVLVFGSPCQSYSIAGRRLGLDDPRGNLALVALGIVARLRPRWFVFENVPGLLSSWSGAEMAVDEPGDIVESSDFDTFRWHVDDIGYSGAWAVLDAQWFGVAQRRARLFFVGHLGADWRRPAAVLLEPDRLCGHPPARGEAGKDVAGSLRAGAGGGCWPGPDEAAQGMLISSSGTCARALTTSNQRIDYETETLIAHTLRADGFDASEDGTGRRTPLVAIADPNQPIAQTVALRGRKGGGSAELGGDTATALRASQGGGDKPYVLVASRANRSRSDVVAGPVAIADPNQITSRANRSRPNAAVSHTLPAAANGPIAYALGSHASAADGDQTNRSHASGGPVSLGISEDQAFTLRAGRRQSVCIAGPVTATYANTTSRGGNNGGALDNHEIEPSGVRRLLPLECERLQGFPDHFTAITYRGAPAKDGPRYKAIGNSMAVPVIRWILERLEFVDALPSSTP
jgi:DNA (cytosine-5)-methyltransferase 1